MLTSWWTNTLSELVYHVSKVMKINISLYSILKKIQYQIFARNIIRMKIISSSSSFFSIVDAYSYGLRMQ
jgi:hypothetical protein